MWLKDEGCKEVVSEAWDRALNMEGRKSSNNVMEKIHETKLKLNRMLLVEEDMWQQRSRNCWLKSNDRNTSFSHIKTSNRHQRNVITRIKDSNNVWQEDEEIMGRTFVEYFTQLFTSSQAGVSTKLIEAIQVKVTDRMNIVLLQEFHTHDVEKALNQMHLLKATSPNGMPPIFYPHFWSNVNSIVIKTMLDFLNNGVAPPKFHETHIVLIPKTKNPEKVIDYRPISLCNVAYKLAFKVVANHLKLVLQDIICKN